MSRVGCHIGLAIAKWNKYVILTSKYWYRLKQLM